MNPIMEDGPASALLVGAIPWHGDGHAEEPSVEVRRNTNVHDMEPVHPKTCGPEAGEGPDWGDAALRYEEGMEGLVREP
eukprot:6480746-Amphidinium_carterae.2